MNRSVLFVGHSAHRSGAPILLLNFLRWLREHDEGDFDVVLSIGGDLLPDYRSVAKTEVRDDAITLGPRIMRRLIGVRAWENRRDAVWSRRVAGRGYDLAYVNTVAPQRELVALARRGIPTVCHVHELDYAVQRLLGDEGVAPLIPLVERFVAASASVQEFLIDRCAVPREQVTLVHEFTPSLSRRGLGDGRHDVRASLGLRESDVLVGACGTVEWRKGADLFVQVARRVASSPRGRTVRFAWLGTVPGSNECRQFGHDIRRAGLAGVVTPLESLQDPSNVFAAMDIFALTSREDPFPLAMLEAATHELPIVCFAQSGGGPEFVGDDAGLVAPYLDVDRFADHLFSLAENAELRARLGSSGARRVHDRYSIDVQAPKLKAVIDQVADAQPRPRVRGSNGRR
jgi:glycosyltransferase involved in cell wall biosynthesis